MIRPNGRNCCRRWPMGRRPPGASESLWTVCSLGGQASGFGRNQTPKTDRLNQVPSWEFRNRRKSFTPRQLARILWDFAYLCWASPSQATTAPEAGFEELSNRRGGDRGHRISRENQERSVHNRQARRTDGQDAGDLAKPPWLHNP